MAQKGTLNYSKKQGPCAETHITKKGPFLELIELHKSAYSHICQYIFSSLVTTFLALLIRFLVYFLASQDMQASLGLLVCRSYTNHRICMQYVLVPSNFGHNYFGSQRCFRADRPLFILLSSTPQYILIHSVNVYSNHIPILYVVACKGIHLIMSWQVRVGRSKLQTRYGYVQLPRRCTKIGVSIALAVRP